MYAHDHMYGKRPVRGTVSHVAVVLTGAGGTGIQVPVVAIALVLITWSTI